MSRLRSVGRGCASSKLSVGFGAAKVKPRPKPTESALSPPAADVKRATDNIRNAKGTLHFGNFILNCT